MRQERTGKPDPERARETEAAERGQKRSFFAAAGARLKRVMTGRTEPAPVAAPAPEIIPEHPEDGEVSTSVQARARALLLQDRTHGAGRVRASAEAATLLSCDEEPVRRTSPPPLPSQRTAAEAEADTAEQPTSGITAIAPLRAARAAAKRPVRDSKSDALRARLGAAKAALAEAQAKRAAESGVTTLPSAEAETTHPQAADEADTSAPEITVEDADLVELQLEAADEIADLESLELELELELEAAPVAPDQNPAANSGEADAAEPIRTLTIARLLARQGYLERSLSIYDELLTASADDHELRAEAARVRAKKRGKKNAD